MNSFSSAVQKKYESITLIIEAWHLNKLVGVNYYT